VHAGCSPGRMRTFGSPTICGAKASSTGDVDLRLRPERHHAEEPGRHTVMTLDGRKLPEYDCVSKHLGPAGAAAVRASGRLGRIAVVCRAGRNTSLSLCYSSPARETAGTFRARGHAHGRARGIVRGANTSAIQPRFAAFLSSFRASSAQRADSHFRSGPAAAGCRRGSCFC